MHQETREAERAAGRPRVLVAEDQVELRALVASRLRRDGYDVLEAANGVEAMSLLKAARREHRAPACVVCDVRMPGSGGLEVLARIRAGDLRTPVILVTAFGDPSLHAEAARFGAQVVDKPFDLDDLARAIAHLVAP